MASCHVMSCHVTSSQLKDDTQSSFGTTPAICIFFVYLLFCSKPIFRMMLELLRTLPDYVAKKPDEKEATKVRPSEIFVRTKKGPDENL